ncbi:MAG: cytoplasmic protein [Thermodesulfobacteriota bacterium]|nr:cytoplasmic protein [Thermodesulfobacteriota bacterium]
MHKPFYTNPHQQASRATTPAQEGIFKEFDATELYCPRCNRSMPVRKRLLLVLPEGEKYEYLCAACATSVGTKIVRGGEQIRLVI